MSETNISAGDRKREKVNSHSTRKGKKEGKRERKKESESGSISVKRCQQDHRKIVPNRINKEFFIRYFSNVFQFDQNKKDLVSSTCSEIFYFFAKIISFRNKPVSKNWMQ
jgi:hypothetical protein